jgi:hypothetical protein
VNVVAERLHSFFDDPVGDLLSNLCEPRSWCNKVIAIAHNAKAIDSDFILGTAVFLKWTLELILPRLKIISMKIQHIRFLDSISYLPMPLRILPEAFGLSSLKFPHYYKKKANLNYVGTIHDIQYFGANEMSAQKRRDFMP